DGLPIELARPRDTAGAECKIETGDRECLSLPTYGERIEECDTLAGHAALETTDRQHDIAAREMRHTPWRELLPLLNPPSCLGAEGDGRRRRAFRPDTQRGNFRRSALHACRAEHAAP